MSSPMSTALIPYTPPITAMEFIRSEVERGLKNETLIALVDFSFCFIEDPFSGEFMEEIPLSSRRVDYAPSSAIVRFPSLARTTEKMNKITSFNSSTEDDSKVLESIKKVEVKESDSLVSLVSPTEVIVAAGPGGCAWDRKLIKKMETSLQQDKIITSFTVLGDGEQDLPIESIINAIKAAKAKNLTINCLSKLMER